MAEAQQQSATTQPDPLAALLKDLQAAKKAGWKKDLKELAGIYLEASSNVALIGWIVMLGAGALRHPIGYGASTAIGYVIHLLRPKS